MTECIEIYWTTGNIDEARKISRYLVQERWIASAQIIPWIESISLLNAQLETTQESKVVLKTLNKHYEKIKCVIMENSSYQIPEITYQVIDGGNEEYLSWLHGSIRVE